MAKPGITPDEAQTIRAQARWFSKYGMGKVGVGL